MLILDCIMTYRIVTARTFKQSRGEFDVSERSDLTSRLP